MAHESFEDPATAAVMNALFVNIKVDREERPDLDKIYQTAHQLLARRPGGWPLTVFLTPDDHSPFFAGTYFPPSPRHGLPAFPRPAAPDRERLPRAARGDRRAERLAARRPGCSWTRTTDGEPDDAPLLEASTRAGRPVRRAHGGFGGAPKFPHPGTLRFLLREGAAARRRHRPPHGPAHPGADGQRRHQRPPRRRLLPLLGRRSSG